MKIGNLFIILLSINHHMENMKSKDIFVVKYVFKIYEELSSLIFWGHGGLDLAVLTGCRDLFGVFPTC